MRFFANNYADYDGSPVQIDSAAWINNAKAIAISILNDRRNLEGAIDGGLYVGPAGVAYSLFKLASFLPEPEAKQMLEQSRNLSNLNLRYFQQQNLNKDKTSRVGFLLGK